MTMPLKVLWSEGLSLGPQQFQQQDRYHEGRLRQMARAINPNLWGIRTAAWRIEDLANNTLRADQLSLIFADGEVYDAPAADLLPLAVDLSQLDANVSEFVFHAALPQLKPYGANFSGGEGHNVDARYAETRKETPDLYSESISSNVAFLTKTLHLLSGAVPLDAFEHFPVVKIRRMAGGGFEIDPAFVPPCVRISAVPAMPAMIETLLGKLQTKIDALQSRHRQQRSEVFEFHSGDMASFWMLNSVNMGAALLADLAQSGDLHPRSLFEALRQIAASLLAFSSRYSLANFPKYEHARPGESLAILDAIVRDLIDTVISSKYFKIPLARDEKRTTRYSGKLEAARVNASTMLYLAVSADMPALELVAMVPLRFKVGAPEDVERAIMSALSGLELAHMAQVPTAVPVRPNTYYFLLRNRADLYPNMLKAQAIALYAPADLKDLKLELLAVSD